MLIKSVLLISILVAVGLVAASPASAQTQTATQAGWVEVNGNSRNGINANNNIITGVENAEDWRSFVTFAVPSTAQNYATAEIRLNASSVTGGPNTLEIFDVSTNVATDPVATVYADLGTGVSYGTATNLAGNSSVVVVLNSQGLAAINAAKGSTITFGMRNATLTTNPDFIFGSSGGSSPRSLVLTSVPVAPVPTMSEWAMILLGLMMACGAALLIQRRQTAA